MASLFAEPSFFGLGEEDGLGVYGMQYAVFEYHTP